MDMLILLSPAKTLQPSHAPVPASGELSDPRFGKVANDIVHELKRWSMKETMQQLKLSDALGATVHNWHQNWVRRGASVAGWTFRGDAFKSLDLPSLPADALESAQRRLVILHGVYGMLRPLDRYSPVRLEMAQPWCHLPGHRTMASFWKTLLPAEIQNLAEAQGEGCILNLASAEYGKVALHGLPESAWIQCTFLERKEGMLKSISAYAKAARGAMARHVLMHNIRHPKDLESFTELGYVFDAEESSPNEKVFVRPLST